VCLRGGTAAKDSLQGYSLAARASNARWLRRPAISHRPRARQGNFRRRARAHSGAMQHRDAPWSRGRTWFVPAPGAISGAAASAHNCRRG